AHVGLAGGEPDFADDHVADGVGVGALNNEVATGGGGGQRGEVDAPAAVGAGGGGEGLAGEAHRDAFAGVGGAPDGHGFFALEHGSVAEDGGEGDGRRQGAEQEAGEKGEAGVHRAKGRGGGGSAHALHFKLLPGEGVLGELAPEGSGGVFPVGDEHRR